MVPETSLSGIWPGDHADPELVAHHQHQVFLVAGFVSQVFTVSRELEVRRLHVFLVDRCGYQYIDMMLQ